MGDSQGKLKFTPDIADLPIRQWSLLLKADPHRLFYVHFLTLGTGSRFSSSREQGNVEQSIISLAKAILVPLPQDAPSSFLIIVQIFYCLTLSLFSRIMDSMRPQDVKCCVRHFRYLHGQWHEISMNFPLPVTTALVYVLAVQVKLELGDIYQDIDEMAGLCDELLNSDVSIQSLTCPLTVFTRVIHHHLENFHEYKICSKKVTNCLRKIILRLPSLHEASIVLSRSLYNRFITTSSDDDYEEAMSTLDKVLTFRGPGDEPSQSREGALYLAALLSSSRFDVYGKPEDLEHAIYRHRAMVDGTSIKDPHRAIKVDRLSYFEGLRLDRTANSRDAEFVVPPKLGMRVRFRDLISSLPEAMSVEPNSTEAFNKHIYALDPSRIDQLTDVTDIEDGIKYCRHLLISYPRSDLASIAQSAFGILLNRTFELTHNIEYLNEAISFTRDSINAVELLGSRAALVGVLISFLFTRLTLLRHKEDLDELMQLFPTAVEHSDGGPHAQLTASFSWAITARRFRHPSALTAYDHVMSLFHASLTFAPTLNKQHSRLAMSRRFHTIPLDYASYHIHNGHLKQAIETLERGRGLLWSEMRGLRTSMDQIRVADSNLADKFHKVNRELEILAMSLSLNNNGYGNDNVEGMDPYGHSVTRKQKLLDDRENLIMQIRALSGFETFLKPPSFDTLRSAAIHGPVIVINHSQWRSDILILLHNSPPSLIPTSDDFYIRANKLQDQLLAERKKGLESDAYEVALRAALKELYELVGQPVIKRLNELKIPEQSRVWWCPTSVFCSLPLHAMGPIPSDVGPPRYFLDLYIPSYTPSLSALIDSHKPDSQTFKKPSILLVVQPDASMVRALDEMKVVQRASSRATTLIGATATPSVVLERLWDHRFVHIVCHGLLEPGNPFDSSFKLHRGKRLSLHDMVRPQLPNAEFAFLAACHTAELTDDSPVDEVLHLAAAMQHCGFRSVVGTMWAMADADGRDLAENFYKSVFSSRKQGVPYHERTAEALRDAVVSLRRRRGRRMCLERWVNYVHYGA